MRFSSRLRDARERCRWIIYHSQGGEFGDPVGLLRSARSGVPAAMGSLPGAPRGGSFAPSVWKLAAELEARAFREQRESNRAAGWPDRRVVVTDAL